MRRLYFILILLIIYSCSEDPTYNNPYSSNCDPEYFAPDSLKLEQVGVASVKLDWKQKVEHVDGYKIDRRVEDGKWEFEYDISNKTEYSDTAAIPDTSIQYRVYAYADDNNSSWIENEIKLLFPSPTDLATETIDDQSIKLNWTDNCDFENGYKIERKIPVGAYTEITELSSNTTEYTDENLDYEATYYYRVRAYTDENNSDYSEETSATTKTIQSPTNLAAETVDKQSIKLSWSDNCDFETGYKIERKQSGGTFSEIADLSANATEYTDAGLSQDVEYTYRVIAYTSDNYSDYSNSLSIINESYFKKHFVEVQGGTFTMGDVWGDGDSDETPTHEVTVRSFYMSKYEVTHADYIEFLNSRSVASDGSYNGNEVIDMDARDCAIAHDGYSFYFDGSSPAGDEQCPVIEVNWYGACEYCNWLSEQEGLTNAYTISNGSVECDWNANGYRLPTEAEWEYAARSGGRDDRKYSGTNSESDLGDYAWYYSNSGSEIHPVGTKQPNDLGIYDMSGSVWEWCWDWWDSDYYSDSPSNNPTGPSSGSDRILRGGSCSINASYCRSADRDYHSPAYGSSGVGFRILRTQ